MKLQIELLIRGPGGSVSTSKLIMDVPDDFDTSLIPRELDEEHSAKLIRYLQMITHDPQAPEMTTHPPEFKLPEAL